MRAVGNFLARALVAQWLAVRDPPAVARGGNGEPCPGQPRISPCRRRLAKSDEHDGVRLLGAACLSMMNRLCIASLSVVHLLPDRVVALTSVRGELVWSVACGLPAESPIGTRAVGASLSLRAR